MSKKEEKFKIGFIGAGLRMQEYYVPVIRAMERAHFSDVKLECFMTRSDETAELTEKATGLQRCESFEKLNEEVDACIVCVPANALESATLEALSKTTLDLLVETPVTSQKVVAAAKTQEGVRTITLAENWPFRPAEIMKQEIVRSGLLGRPNFVVNDFRGYEYHGFAMLRALLGYPRPITASGNAFNCGPVRIKNPETGEEKTLEEIVITGLVEFDNNTRAIYNFNSIHSRAKTRGTRSIRVMCENGSVQSDDFKDFRASWNEDGVPKSSIATYSDDADGNPWTIRIKDEGFMKRYPYEISMSCIPYLDIQQRSTYELIKQWIQACKGKQPNPYPLEEGVIDYQCFQALRQSAMQGQKLRFT